MTCSDIAAVGIGGALVLALALIGAGAVVALLLRLARDRMRPR